MAADVTRLPPPKPARLRKCPAKVLGFSGITRLNLPADRVLKAVIGKLDTALVLGIDKEGKFYGAASFADCADVLWLMEICKQRLLADD